MNWKGFGRESSRVIDLLTLQSLPGTVENHEKEQSR
jgi:hypothetical protein